MRYIILAPAKFFLLLVQSILLALSQIWNNKTRSVLTTTGIIIGVASVVAVIASLTGLKANVLDEFEAFGTNKIFIWPHWPATGPQKDAHWQTIRFTHAHFEGLLEHCPSVEAWALAGSVGSHTIRSAYRAIEGIQMQAAQPAWFGIENRTFSLGRPFSDMDEMQARFVCIIDPELRDDLGLDQDCIGQIIRAGRHTFSIVGVIEPQPQGMVGGPGRGQAEMYIPYNTALRLNRDIWASARATSRSTELSPDARAEIEFFLRRTRNIPPGQPDTFGVFTVEAELERFNQIAVIITAVAGGVVGISLLVGGVGIMNIMLVSVSERTREIGLRKAIGAKKSAILLQFLVESIILCLIGGAIGIGFGRFLTWVIASASPVMERAQIPAWAIILALAFSSTVGVIFGMFPAVKAAQLNPIEALRHE